MKRIYGHWYIVVPSLVLAGGIVGAAYLVTNSKNDSFLIFKSSALTTKQPAKKVTKKPTKTPPVSSSNKNSTKTTARTDTTGPSDNQGEIYVYYDNYGFDPNVIQAPIGTKIVIKDISSKVSVPIWIQPNPESVQMQNKFTLTSSSPVSFTVTGSGNSGNWQFEANHQPETRAEINIGPLSVPASGYPNPPVTGKNLTITDGDFGFEPNEVKVPVGTTITLVNGTTGTQPGPTLYQQGSGMGSENPALNIGILQKKQSKSFLITTTGSWLLQNYDQPLQKAFAKISSY